MDQAALVDRDIENGRRLIQALDLADFPVVAAFWSFITEESVWRLQIASPRVDEMGPIAVYTEIQGVLRASASTLPLRRISVLPENDALVTDLRLFAGTPGAPYLGGSHLFRTVLGDTFIEGAYVYRAERVVCESGTQERILVSPDRQKKVWTAYRCILTFKEGLFDEIQVDGFDWPMTRSRHGLNARLYVLSHHETKDGLTTGDVERWVVANGQIQSIGTEARGVQVRRLSETMRHEEAGNVGEK
jgi:hypothetical protein